MIQSLFGPTATSGSKMCFKFQVSNLNTPRYSSRSRGASAWGGVVVWCFCCDFTDKDSDRVACPASSQPAESKQTGNRLLSESGLNGPPRKAPRPTFSALKRICHFATAVSVDQPLVDLGPSATYLQSINFLSVFLADDPCRGRSWPPTLRMDTQNRGNASTA